MRKIVSALLAASVIASLFASATFAGNAYGCAWGKDGWSTPSCSNTPTPPGQSK